MWPKRKIQVVVTPTSEGVPGLQALLDTLGQEYVLAGAGESGFNGNSPIGENDPGQATPPTDLIYWPGVEEQDGRVVQAKDLGIVISSVADFLHKAWKSDVILAASSSGTKLQERPLLWCLLESAGFGPSLLWPSGDGGFLAHKGQGSHWVVSAAWLAGVAGEGALGRTALLTKARAVWKQRADRVDFYFCHAEHQEEFFVGSLPRWSDVQEETSMCSTIAQGMELGVSWGAVCNSLGLGKKRRLAVVEVESA